MGLMKGRRQDRNTNVVSSFVEKQPQTIERTVQPSLSELLHDVNGYE